VSLPYGDGLTPIPNLGCLPSNNCYSEDPTEHHFTGKERDAESGNDYFGARYYASSMGRFMSPDWSVKADPVPYAKLDNPQTLNLYDYMRNNPLGGIDTDGHDVVLLNDSNAAVGQGHNATLVGNDKGGWTYYSHDGYGSSGKDNPQHFGSFSDFQNGDASGRYDRGTRFSTNSDQDKAMNKVGTDEIKKPYDVTERGNHQNCADLSADVMKAGGLNTDKPKELTTPEMSTPAIQTPLGTIPSVTIPSVQVPAPITNPNQQYRDTVKNNNGTTVQPHCTGPNCH
jgi:RHS repeat-associated protein